MRIQHISFDVWGTLLKSNPDYKPARNALIRELFGDFIEDDIIKYNKEQFDIMTECTGYQPDYKFTLASILGTYIRKVNPRTFNIKAREFRYKNDNLVMKYPPLVIDGVFEIMSKLKDSPLTLSILSNTSFIEGRTMRKVLDMHFPKTFSLMMFSDEAGMAKPHPSLFQAVARTMQKPETSILHIGDNTITDSGANITRSYIIEPNKLHNHKDKIYALCNLLTAQV